MHGNLVFQTLRDARTPHTLSQVHGEEMGCAASQSEHKTRDTIIHTRDSEDNK